MNIINKGMAAVVAASMAFTSCSQTNKHTTETEGKPDTKSIVCYFSATGTTADAAGRIARIARADLYEIVPETRYTAADLDWTDSLSRSYVEMHNRSFRPAMSATDISLEGYDVVFIGYPNWWNTHPTIINTFIESNDLAGKTVVPFMTSGGSTIANSEKELRESYPELTFGQGILMNGKTDDEVKEWIDGIGR